MVTRSQADGVFYVRNLDHYAHYCRRRIGVVDKDLKESMAVVDSVLAEFTPDDLKTWHDRKLTDEAFRRVGSKVRDKGE